MRAMKGIVALALLAFIAFSGSASAQSAGIYQRSSSGVANTTPVGIDNPLYVQSSAGAGLTPIASGVAEGSHLFKASSAEVWSIAATNLTGTAGFLVLLNALSVPGDGAITPLACGVLPANGTTSISYGGQPSALFGTGIVAVATSAVSCFTKTTGVITALFSGSVQ